jgi:hypothetical protein
MIKEPSKLVAARAALEKAEEDLGDPGRLGHLRNAINFFLRVMSGVSPQIEKDIAKKLVLTYRNKVLSEVKIILANFDSYESGSLEHWNKVMEVFVDASLADDPAFNACKEQLLRRRGSQPIDSLKAAHVDILKKRAAVSQSTKRPLLESKKEVRTTLHAKSLRVIGQSLEMLRLRAFRLEKKGDFYIVRSESLTATHEWILRNNLAENILDSPVPDQKSTQLTVGDGWLCYGPLDIARLNARERQKRDNHGFEQTREADNLAQLLRTLGEHLDSKKATAFKISWAPDSVSVDYQTPNGVRERKEFTVEKLHQLALYSRFRR